MLGVSGLVGSTSGDAAAAAASAAAAAAAATVASGEAPESGGSSEVGGGAGGGVMVPGGFSEEDKTRIDEGERNSSGNRWPRQETLDLLRIRSEMDIVFRDSSLKGPLWEDVSRKMADLGYQRSAKKCKEKFENVYKYHKRTKQGRASKADGKTYRFFEQIESMQQNNTSQFLPPPPPLAANPITMAMPMSMSMQVSMPMSQGTQNPYANTAAAATTAAAQGVRHPFSLSPSQPPLAVPPKSTTTLPSSHPVAFESLLSNSTSSSSSTSSDEDIQRRRHKKKRKWKDLFETLMKDVVEKQEDLQKKFLETLEKRERERMVREESWRVQEMARMNREHDLLVQERSIAASKDAALISYLQKIAEQQNVQIPNSIKSAPTPIQLLQLSQAPVVVQPHSRPQPPVLVPAPSPPTMTTISLPMTIPAPIPTQAPPLPPKTLEAPKTDTGGERLSPVSSSRWPKAEVEALIMLRTQLDLKYQENGPKGPLWEDISAGMRKLGYNRNSKRCKEKWENINKYFKKVKESSKSRPEDSKTCPYFHQLDALYRAKNGASLSTVGFALKPENNPSMAPIMARPEQQWPVLPQDQDRENDHMHQNDQEVDDEDEDDDDDDEGDAYEIVPNKQPSSMAATTTVK